MPANELEGLDTANDTAVRHENSRVEYEQLLGHLIILDAVNDPYSPANARAVLNVNAKDLLKALRNSTYEQRCVGVGSPHPRSQVVWLHCPARPKSLSLGVCCQAQNPVDTAGVKQRFRHLCRQPGDE